jgi:hypothetical protein
LGSRNGTSVNGIAMESGSARMIDAADEITIGETKVHVALSTDTLDTNDGLNITLSLDAVKPAYKFEGHTHPDTDRRLAILYELPLHFGAEIQFDVLLGIIVSRLMEVVRGMRAPRWFSLIPQQMHSQRRICLLETLLTLARRALKEQLALFGVVKEATQLGF